LAGLCTLWLGLASAGRSPRELADFAAREASSAGAALAPFYMRAARLLEALDRPAYAARRTADAPLPDVSPSYPAWAGAQVRTVAAPTAGRVRRVSDPAELRAAIDSAMPGDRIELARGRYFFTGKGVDIVRGGTGDAPISVRADRLGDATLEFEMVEGFHVQAPYWQFENLVIRGACQDDSSCEHAFHVTGDARGTLIRNNRIEDFNAQIKINAANGAYPDAGVIEGNTLVNTRPRHTDVSVTPIDLVAASDWRVEGNLIADFIKLGGNQVSYGAFFKGAGSRNLFQRNVVLCEYRLRGFPGQHIGLSLGGGGTSKGLCRDGGQCVLEQSGGQISYNLIQGCSDVGIYLNKAADSTLAHNTVLDTAGVLVRFAESSARLSGNLVDGNARTRDDAVLHDDDSRMDAGWLAFLGMHPTRKIFVDMSALDYHWRDSPPVLRVHAATAMPAAVDLCGRGGNPAIAGAFAEFQDCLGGSTPR
jgi:parallel beta-helix repeat protein